MDINRHSKKNIAILYNNSHNNPLKFKNIFLLFIVFSCFFFSALPGYCVEFDEGEREILDLNLSQRQGVVSLNNYLASDNILDYLSVRERLLTLSYEELLEFYKQIKALGSLEKLITLTEDLISQKEKEDICFLREDILINNRPRIMDSPFYDNAKGYLDITELRPYAERMYFYNLKLSYRDQDLFKKSPELWINPGLIAETEGSRPDTLSEEDSPLGTFQFKGRFKKDWSFELTDDLLTDYFYLRQWIKRYQENALDPVVYKNTVILRNEYRLFCLDILQGKVIWTLGDIDQKGEEFYQTFRHPHHNMYGYGFLLKADNLFTELSGKLIALNLTNILEPEIIWTKDLGEYLLAARPILKGEILVCLVINARGELWACGFDKTTGDLKWSSSIGSSSFLSPASNLYAVLEDRIVIATNHGVLICLDSDKGKIVWLRKYNPRLYNLFEFWMKGYYNAGFFEEATINYDTQFMEIDKEGLLYYKPRESDYLYILDPLSGNKLKDLLIDSKRYYLLRARGGKAVLLDRKKDSLQALKLRVIDLDTKAEIYSFTFEPGVLKGVHYLNDNELLFKINNKLHYLNLKEGYVSHEELVSLEDGWLLNFKNGFLFSAKGKSLDCWSALDNKTGLIANSHLGQVLEQREKIKKEFFDLMKSKPISQQDYNSRDSLLKDIINSKITLDDIASIIITNIEEFKQPVWSGFIAALNKTYGKETIIYQDIRLRFANFLLAHGLINQGPLGNQGNIDPEEKENDKRDSFSLTMDRACILPLEIIEGPKHPNFFLLLNNDQLICVGESGNIRWERKVFYRPLPTPGISRRDNRGRLHMYTDDAKAYLFKNTLIINDRINIVAVNLINGDYLWSMTNQGEDFIKESEHPPLPNKEKFYKKFGAKQSFLKDIMFFSEFMGNDLILLHKNMIYSLDPETGYCKRSKALDIDTILKLHKSEGRIYLLSYSLERIKVLDKDFCEVGDFLLDFVEEDLSWPELVFLDDTIILNIGTSLYSIDKQQGGLINRVKLGRLDKGDRRIIQVSQGKLLVIEPFRKAMRYRLEDRSLVLDWEFEFDTPDQHITWAPIGKKTNYNFLVDKYLILLSKRDGKFFITCLDFDSADKLWERSIDHSGTLFYNLSDYLRINEEEIIFCLSIACYGKYDKEHLCLRSGRVNVSSRLINLTLKEGDMMELEPLPPIGDYAFNSLILQETANYYIYDIYGKILKAKRKQNENL